MNGLGWISLAWLPVGVVWAVVALLALRQRSSKPAPSTVAPVRASSKPECRVRGCKNPPEWHYRVDLVSRATDGEGFRCVFGLDVCSDHSFILKDAVHRRWVKLAIDLERARPWTDRRPAA